MAQGSRRLALVYSPESLADLDEIWEWNVGSYGVMHADAYISFLTSATLRLTQFDTPGDPIPASSYRYAILRRRRKGHGHVVAFTVENRTLFAWHYYHTSQDWQIQLLSGRPLE